MIDENLSLQEIENDFWGKPKFPSGLVISCHKIRTLPLKDFKPEHIRMMVGQRLSLPILMPKAISILSSNPLINSYYFEGDLLAVTLRCTKYFELNPEHAAQVVKICNAAIARFSSKGFDETNSETISLCEEFLMKHNS